MDVVINQERFSAADVTISMLGRIVLGVAKIDWKESQTVEPVYVTGNRESVGHTVSKRGYSGSVELLNEEFQGLKLAGGGSVLKLAAFPITIVKNKNGIIIKETLTGVKFTNADNSADGGSSGALMTQLQFWCSEVK
jgi:hypothetical protein